MGFKGGKQVGPRTDTTKGQGTSLRPALPPSPHPFHQPHIYRQPHASSPVSLGRGKSPHPSELSYLLSRICALSESRAIGLWVEACSCTKPEGANLSRSSMHMLLSPNTTHLPQREGESCTVVHLILQPPCKVEMSVMQSLGSSTYSNSFSSSQSAERKEADEQVVQLVVGFFRGG